MPLVSGVWLINKAYLCFRVMILVLIIGVGALRYQRRIDCEG